MVGCDTSTIFYSATHTIPRKQVASLASSVLDKISAVPNPLGTKSKARQPTVQHMYELMGNVYELASSHDSKAAHIWVVQRYKRSTRKTCFPTVPSAETLLMLY